MTTDVSSELIKNLKAQLNKGSAASIPAAPVAEPILEVKKVFVIGKDEVPFSKVFGYTPKFGDFGVKVLSGLSPDVQRMVPSVDPDYVVQKEEAAVLVAGIMDGDKSLITGPTGSGKSSLVKYVCAKLNWPFIRINMSGDVESSALFGTLVVEGGATIWRDGAITEACKSGAVCLVDEWELMPAEIAMGMQNLLEDGGYLYLKEKPGTSEERTVTPADNFRLVFAGNTVGQGDTSGAFTGVGVQNTATIDRFTSTVHLTYLDAKHEIAIITGKTGAPKEVAANMVKLATMVRNAYNSGKLGLTMSPRTLINWGRKMQRYGIQDGFSVAFVQKLNEDDKVSVMEFYKKVF
jgi:cobaltochelatase CobS